MHFSNGNCLKGNSCSYKHDLVISTVAHEGLDKFMKDQTRMMEMQNNQIALMNERLESASKEIA